jgi:outer membrane lipoprotein SlyB
MKTFALVLAAALPLAALAQYDGPEKQAPATTQKSQKAKPLTLENCPSCGKVEAVREEKRKGEGGAVGIVGGAVVGGLLGNQIGGGSGRALATVGGAVAGGYVGNEVQKNVNSKQVWVTEVRMKDGSLRTFERDAKPSWKVGTVLRVKGDTLSY